LTRTLQNALVGESNQSRAYRYPTHAGSASVLKQECARGCMSMCVQPRVCGDTQDRGHHKRPCAAPEMNAATAALLAGVRAGERYSLSRAITLGT
jgi:hypothetical protein